MEEDGYLSPDDDFEEDDRDDYDPSWRMDFRLPLRERIFEDLLFDIYEKFGTRYRSPYSKWISPYYNPMAYNVSYYYR